LREDNIASFFEASGLDDSAGIALSLGDFENLFTMNNLILLIVALLVLSTIFHLLSNWSSEDPWGLDWDSDWGDDDDHDTERN